MAETYYKPCSEFDRCNELIEKYWNTKQFEKCFEGHMELAEKGYPLAECQVGYFQPVLRKIALGFRPLPAVKQKNTTFILVDKSCIFYVKERPKGTYLR